MTSVRRMGIALGSLVAAWLVIWLVGGQTLGTVAGVLVIILGALIYLDIMRRDRQPRP